MDLFLKAQGVMSFDYVHISWGDNSVCVSGTFQLLIDFLFNNQHSATITRPQGALGLQLEYEIYCVNKTLE